LYSLQFQDKNGNKQQIPTSSTSSACLVVEVLIAFNVTGKISKSCKEVEIEGTPKEENSKSEEQ
jgi:hypothetical protein